MIHSLEQAWKWYKAIQTPAYDMKRLAVHWDKPEWAPALSRDNRFRDRTSAELGDMANTILEDLDDLAVLVMFSVFESSVRSHAGRM